MEKKKKINNVTYYTKKIFKTAAYFCTALSLIFLLFCWAGQINLFPQKSLFRGITYLPAFWLILFIIPSFIESLLTGNKKLAFVLIGLYIIYFLFYGDIAFIKPKYDIPEKSTEISVMVLNVEFYNHGLEKVIKEIKDIDADISLLSENVLSQDELEYVKKEIYPRFFFTGKAGETALISKYPVIECKEVELPSHQASLSGPNSVENQSLKPYRSFIHAVIDPGDTRLHIISIRFIAGRPASQKIKDQLEWGNYIANTQAEEIDFFKDYIGKLEGPVIFGGDLNAPPGSRPIRELNKIATDAYMANHIYGNLTFSVETPVLRLDYLYFMGKVIPLKTEVLYDSVVSDHYPVYGEFLITHN